jgi:hypothetical protein
VPLEGIEKRGHRRRSRYRQVGEERRSELREPMMVVLEQQPPHHLRTDAGRRVERVVGLAEHDDLAVAVDDRGEIRRKRRSRAGRLCWGSGRRGRTRLVDGARRLWRTASTGGREGNREQQRAEPPRLARLGSPIRCRRVHASPLRACPFVSNTARVIGTRCAF